MATKVNVQNSSILVELDKANSLKSTVNGEPFEIDQYKVNDHTYHIIHNHVSYLVEINERIPDENKMIVRINNKKTEVSYKTDRDLLLESMGFESSSSQKMKDLKAPMPGLVVQVGVKVGDEVEKGDPLIILEAMKMENIIKASGSGKIKEILAKQGAAVEKNAVLIKFD